MSEFFERQFTHLGPNLSNTVESMDGAGRPDHRPSPLRSEGGGGAAAALAPDAALAADGADTSDSEGDMPSLGARPRPPVTVWRREQHLRALSALPDDEQERRVARALRLGEGGFLDAVPGGRPIPMGDLQRLAIRLTAIATADEEGVDQRPSAADPAALFATAPKGLRVTAAEALTWQRPPTAEGPGVHPRVNGDVLLQWHRQDGCTTCGAGPAAAPPQPADVTPLGLAARAGREVCYIHALRRHAEAFKLPFKAGQEPTQLLDPARGTWKAADVSSESDRELVKAVEEYLGAGIFEAVVDPGDFRQCAAIAPVHMARKQGLKVQPSEAAAVEAGDVKGMAPLAQARAGEIFEGLQKSANGGAWTRESVDAAMAAHRDGQVKWRFVVGLHRTVNDRVEDWPFRYVDFEEEWVAADPPWSSTDHVSKMDLLKGFYAVEIAEEDRRFFCFRDPRDATGRTILRYKRLPMGFKLSPAVFSLLTSEVARHFNRSECGMSGALYRFYVDDLAIKAHADRAAKAHDYARAEAPKADLRWGSGPGKDDAPAQANIITGRRFDSNVGGQPMVSVAPKALFTALVDLELLRLAAGCDLARIPAEWLRSMAGRVSWVAQSTYAARLHTGSLWYAATVATSKHSMVPVARIGGLANDAAWFMTAARDGRLRGERRVMPAQLEPEAVEHVFSDAAGAAGAAAYWREHVVYHAWESGERAMSIQAKELNPVVAAAEHFASQWRGKMVIFHTDNLGNAYGINRGKAMAGAARELLQRLYDLADEYGFHFVALWLPRRANVKADVLSKAASFEAAKEAAKAHGFEAANVSEY